jgi:pantetheine-phosphate adenylyltransferase
MSPKRERSRVGPAAAGRIAVYAGSFDPITRGHEDVIRRSLEFVDRLVVAVAINASKQPLFESDERLDLIRAAVGGDPRIDVRSFTGLLVEFAEEVGARLIIRGLRAVSDFEYEFQMALMNRHLTSGRLETVFMVPSLDTTYISSSIVREVARYGGNIQDLVHPRVAEALRSKFRA